MKNFTHTPVLLEEVLALLDPKKGESVLDCTLGLGGHASSMLSRIGTKGILLGIDADERNLNLAKKNVKGKNVSFLHCNFGQLHRVLDADQKFDIIFADLGLSSPHLDDPERGFTFRADAPLDMRLDQSQIMTAAKIIEHYSDEGLVTLFREEGELSNPRRLVQCIRKAMQGRPMLRSSDLNDAVKAAYGYKANGVLPQVYQALRMAVNREREMLASFLEVAPHFLSVGGRLGIISFHSLEDRLVKQVFRALSTPTKDPLTGQIAVPASFEVLTKKPVVPTQEEVDANPRCRSAKFRALIRLRPGENTDRSSH